MREKKGRTIECVTEINEFDNVYFIPRYSSAFEMIRERDVVRPDVELPLPQSQNPAEHRSAVDPYSHVQIHL